MLGDLDLLPGCLCSIVFFLSSQNPTQYMDHLDFISKTTKNKEKQAVVRVPQNDGEKIKKNKAEHSTLKTKVR